MELTEALPQYTIENFENSGHSEPAHSLSYATLMGRNILNDIMQFRRIAGPRGECSTTPCPHCLAPHLSKIVSSVREGRPVTFVLPAFPGKSPNSNKVLGPLPDMAEKCALEFLQNLCDRIKKIYAPGARIILCSDGRVFSDVVGMRDEDVTAYQDEISKMIAELGLKSISTFNLEEIYGDLDFDQMRTQIMSEYGEPLEALKAEVSRGKAEGCTNEEEESNRLYCGITRFLLEDAMTPGQTKSRTALQKECRTRAYSVIQRSKAWGELVEDKFPDAVRLSIHPQSCGGKKIGIRMIQPDNWQTPWHGVAVQVEERYILLKRSQAEALGAQLVTESGRPSHYVLANTDGLAKLFGKQDEA